MKRIQRNPEKFGVIDLFESIARKRDLRLNDADSQAKFLGQLSHALGNGQSNPIVVHGRRIESMFEYVAASLGKCMLIKREDSGDICSTVPGIMPPDFRVVLEDGEEVFVEIKNCHATDPNYRYKLKDAYLKSLKDYVQVFGRKLWIGIFWSRWKKWTLLDPKDFRHTNQTASISFIEAIPRNQMAILGDSMIGTNPPLAFRVIADPTKPRDIDEFGQVSMSIGNVEVYCSGRHIVDHFEQQLAFYFMLHSDWICEKPRAEIVDNNLVYIEYLIQPEQQTPGQGFEILGNLSDMMSRRFNDLTSSEGNVDRLSPAMDPGTLGILIPPEYQGNQLPLWRFLLTPK